MRRQVAIFILRLVTNAFSLWLAVLLLAGQVELQQSSLVTFVLAGLFLSIANSLLKPIIIILSLPAILLTLGLFMLIVNGLMVYIALNLVPGVEISFVSSIVAAIIIWLINYAISGILELGEQPKGADRV